MALRVITALVAYAVGVGCGAWMNERLRWSLPVMLLVEVVLLAAAAVLWALGLITSDGDRLGLLVLIAVAMGVQGRIRATPTNYFTGTLTALVGRAALRSWERGDHWVVGQADRGRGGRGRDRADRTPVARRGRPGGGGTGGGRTADRDGTPTGFRGLTCEDSQGRGKPRPDRGNPAGAAQGWARCATSTYR